MLSYQHAFHAGNLADVQKHALLAWVLEYMTRKDKPLTYIESHAGRGLYHMSSEAALKTGEAEQGITKLEAAFPEDHPYRLRLEEARGMYGEDCYPGSPLIAALGLRETDKLHLAELHTTEHAALKSLMESWGANVRREDGLDMAMAMTPPTPRRGLLMVDPSYEIKTDYEDVPSLFFHVARKWNVGVMMLWYPILRNDAHKPMLDRLVENHPDHLRHEVTFPPARENHRMIGSGMFIVNPPYGMDAEAAKISEIFAAL